MEHSFVSSVGIASDFCNPGMTGLASPRLETWKWDHSATVLVAELEMGI